MHGLIFCLLSLTHHTAMGMLDIQDTWTSTYSDFQKILTKYQFHVGYCAKTWDLVGSTKEHCGACSLRGRDAYFTNSNLIESFEKYCKGENDVLFWE